MRTQHVLRDGVDETAHGRLGPKPRQRLEDLYEGLGHEIAALHVGDLVSKEPGHLADMPTIEQPSLRSVVAAKLHSNHRGAEYSRDGEIASRRPAKRRTYYS